MHALDDNLVVAARFIQCDIGAHQHLLDPRDGHASRLRDLSERRSCDPRVEHSAFIDKYNAIEWENRDDYFEAWKSGRTGYPIVDAGMRQLRATGWMHNRVRMIVASFLVKDLHINWQWGERYFMEDAQREQETIKVRNMIETSCK